MTVVPDFALKPTLTGRISLEVYAFNPRARRVYERVGFRAEGVLRESLRYGDRWIDASMMFILASQWPPAPAGR